MEDVEMRCNRIRCLPLSFLFLILKLDGFPARCLARVAPFPGQFPPSIAVRGAGLWASVPDGARCLLPSSTLFLSALSPRYLCPPFFPKPTSLPLSSNSGRLQDIYPIHLGTDVMPLQCNPFTSHPLSVAVKTRKSTHPTPTSWLSDASFRAPKGVQWEVA